MSQVVVDRGILKAFYTQYVAVLLIMLVFTLAARALQLKHSPDSVSKSIPDVAALMGRMSIHNNLFPEAGAPIRKSPELDAVAEILRNHDLRASFHVSLPLTEGRNASAVFAQGLLRAEEIRKYLLNQNVSPSAVRVAVQDGASTGADISVDFESVEVPHARR